jgi:hypothetical protein
MAPEPALMIKLTRILATTHPSQPLANRLISALSTTLEMDGGSITIGYTTDERSTLCSTDAVAEQVEELQDLLREGPSLDAFRIRRPVAEELAEQGRRWPTLLQSLEEHHDAIRLFAVPMQPEAEILGVISLYRLTRERVDFDRDGAQFLADAIGVAILGRFERAESTDLVWSTRDRIYQATGMVVAQLRISPLDALAVLRAHAFAHGATLADVADSVVTRQLDFRDSDGERRSP